MITKLKAKLKKCNPQKGRLTVIKDKLETKDDKKHENLFSGKLAVYAAMGYLRLLGGPRKLHRPIICFSVIRRNLTNVFLN